MNACFEFRGRLADLLSGRRGSHRAGPKAVFGELSWHEHLLACESCRGLIEAEEALDELLASLPEPHLPAALTRRLLARLEPARAEAELDLLLDRSEAEPAPVELARNVLARLAGPRRVEREDRALDRLLAELPEPVAPPGLASRVLAALEPDLAVAPGGRAFGTRGFARPRDASWSRIRVALAAALLVGAGAGTWWGLRVPEEAPIDSPQALGATPRSTEGAPEIARLIEAPTDELLASLDLLESWDLLADAGVEADVNALGPLDELLLGLDMDARAR